MAEQAGKLQVVYVLSGSSAMTSSTGEKVNGADNSSMNKMAELLEISQFGDSYRDRIVGLKDTNVTLSGNYDPDDTNGQDVLDDPGAEVFIGLYPKGTTETGKQVNALIESFEISSDATGKQTFSCTLQGIAEPVTLPAQSA